MTAKEYLRQLNGMRKHLAYLRSKLEELELESINVGGIRYDKDRVQTSPEDHMPGKVEEVLKAEQNYQKMLGKYHLAVQQRLVMIEKLDNPIHIQVLTLRYCEGMTFEQIAVEMVYSYRQVLRLHGNALSSFGRKYSNRFTVKQ